MKTVTTNPALQQILDLHHQGQVERAGELCDQYLTNHPNDTEALYHRAMMLVGENKPNQAAPLLRKAVNVDPTFLEAMITLGKLRTQIGRMKAAARIFWRALKVDPHSAEAFHGLGVLYQQAGKLEKAYAFYEKSAALKPTDLVYANMGHVQKGLGNLSAAAEAFHKALTMNPLFTKAYQSLSSLKQYRFTQDDISAMQHLLATAVLSADEKSALHFALGKAFDDEKQFAKAFSHFEEANQLTRKKITYKSAQTENVTSKMIETFSADFMKSRMNVGHKSEAPIFVVSMPRSGSTLVEQILASHSLVLGGNELPDLQQVSSESRIMISKNVDFFTNLSALTPEHFERLGTLYLDRIKRRYKSNKPYFTDKMPFNFHLIGFIQLILPNAKIIHVKRNPIDTCMGCYKLPFNDQHEFTYNLTELGHYYGQYDRLMKHWHTLLPGKIFEIEYETLVSNQDAQTRRLLDFCGLPWEENCLSFYNTKREVITESAGQVRQPIYQHAVGQWKHYEAFIQPLLMALRPAL